MKLLLVESPKSFWFIMQDYLPPPYNILLLAAVVEQQLPDVEVQVVDCQAEGLDWFGLEERIRSERPDIIGTGSHATTNVYKTIRTCDIAKRVDPDIITLAGGSHFTALDESTLGEYPVLDVIIRYEGERALVDLLRHFMKNGYSKHGLEQIQGISFQRNGIFKRTADWPPLIGDELDQLPYPAYHLLPDMSKYHFQMMSDNPYVILEGSRGCNHQCTFCSQNVFYRHQWHTKSPQRIANEMEWLYDTYHSRFFWFTDDNFCMGRPKLIESLCQELLSRGLTGDVIEWFAQLRVDSIVRVSEGLQTMNQAGNYWQLVGAESPFKAVLDQYKKGIDGQQTVDAIQLLKKHNILAQLMLIIGHEQETRETIQQTMRWATDVVKPDLIITMVLTPYPGTPLYDELLLKGRIVDKNWTNYDMIHAVTDMEYLTAKELQEELYKAYRHVYDNWGRRLTGVFSKNKYKRRIYWRYMRAGVVGQLQRLISR
jgi:anaerobic magnesium-protoporphyrin IX monomethyl ester cyclase